MTAPDLDVYYTEVSQSSLAVRFLRNEIEKGLRN